MNRVYKVGVLGCARIASRSLLPAFLKSDRFITCGIASRDINKARSVAGQYQCLAYGSYDELLLNKEIDLVYVPLPTGLHYEWIREALERGKHVMSEKSLGVSYVEVQKLTELARQKDLLLIENFQFCHHSQHRWVRDLLDRKEIGEIRCFRSSFGFPPFPDAGNIRYAKHLGGGALLDAGAYTIKAMQFVLPGYSFQLRAASLYKPSNSSVDLHGGAYLDCDEGIVAQLSFGFDNYYQCNYELWGSLGKLTVTRAFTAPADMAPIVILEKQGYREEISLPPDDHFVNMLAHVARCLDTNDFSTEYACNLNQSSYIEQIKNYCNGK